MRDKIVVQNLSKRFPRYHVDRPWTFQEAVLGGLRRMRPTEWFWALHNVSFNVPPGNMIGIIGPNGAGKSTLLRLVGGVGRSDKGRVQTHGRIGALLELGAGFHPDLTGRENVFVNGIVAGFTRDEVAQHFDSIVAFAELEEFIDNPLRTYSSGMQMRLGFAVAAQFVPDILLIDEVLSVGDLAFQKKCLERIYQFKAENCAILFVSHDTSIVKELCDDVLWLREGQVAAHGAADIVVDQYVAEMMTKAEQHVPTPSTELHYPHTGAELRTSESSFG
jgi:lipopolysaccharide transport system ATP-binding protein